MAKWPENDAKYNAILSIASFLATSDEAWTTHDARDDDGTNTWGGWRNRLIDDSGK